MKRKEKQNINFLELIKCNVYAIKLMWEISPKRIVHMVLLPFIDWFSWVFYSTYFIRYLVSAIQNSTPFQHIMSYIMIVCGVTMVLQLYVAYVKNVIVPLNDVKVYTKVYGRMYKKAENLELACFEDSDFYDKYTMALDDACKKITDVTGYLFK